MEQPHLVGCGSCVVIRVVPGGAVPEGRPGGHPAVPPGALLLWLPVLCFACKRAECSQLKLFLPVSFAGMICR